MWSETRGQEKLRIFYADVGSDEILVGHVDYFHTVCVYIYIYIMSQWMTSSQSSTSRVTMSLTFCVQRDEFVAGAPSKAISHFLQWFSETQMFEMFISRQLGIGPLTSMGMLMRRVC